MSLFKKNNKETRSKKEQLYSKHIRISTAYNHLLFLLCEKLSTKGMDIKKDEFYLRYLHMYLEIQSIQDNLPLTEVCSVACLDFSEFFKQYSKWSTFKCTKAEIKQEKVAAINSIRGE